jgi:2-keto-3-deoxy-L-rhamnonate aldolase RhmA
MIELRNRALEQLRSGQLAIGVGLRQARTVDTAKAMLTAGFDWLFIDMEHNSMDIDTAVQISVAAQDAGISPIVRVPGYEHYHATRALDGGAQGVVVPHVDSPATAEQIALNCRYPPIGHRSITGALPQLGFETYPLKDATETINRETLVVVMLESPAAVDNAHQIAAIPGIDALLIGTNDLSLEMGIPGELGHSDIVAAYDSVIAACKTHGKYAGMGGVYKPELMAKYIEMGTQLILAGNDISFLMESARRQASAVRGMLR